MKCSRIFALVATVSTIFVMGCGSSSSPATAKTPDAVVMQVTKAIEQNQPEVAFQALPASYQTDINSVVADTAKKMDKEIWSEGRDVIEQVLKLAKDKKSLILETRMLASNPEKENLSKNWDQSLKMLESVLDSDFTDLSKLREGNVGELLAGSGAELMKQAKAASAKNPSLAEMKDGLDKMKSVKASVESQDGDTATVKIEAEGETPEIVDFVRVEGKWIPKDMADTFATKIAEARANLANIDFTSEEGKATKAQIMTQIGMVKTMLSQAEAAKTSAELEGVMMGIMMGAMSFGGGAMAPTM